MHGHKAAVFGSSTGALVFYSVLALDPPLTCTGYEVLPFLAERAEAMRAKHGVDGAHLRCEDCLQADVTDAAAMIVCSLCWPDSLHDAVADRLTAQMRPGAAVIAYDDRLIRRGAAAAWGGVPAWRGRVRTSWASRQPVYVFVRAAGDNDGR
jgi:hypothetical protein